MKIFGKQKKEDTEKEQDQTLPEEGGLDGFEQQLESTLREEHTQVIAEKREESKSKAMVRTLLDAGYSIIEINEFLDSNKNYGLKDGQITIMD
jgi:hypothetical protein